MRKTTFVMTLLCAGVAAGLTSCLNSDDDNNNSNQGLSAADIAFCASAVSGSHSGYLVYEEQNPVVAADRYDSLAVNWDFVNDSTMLVRNFPASLLAKNVTNPQLKEALAAAEDKTLECRIYFNATSPIGFYINPLKLDYTLSYGDATHTVQVYFLNYNTYSFGLYDSSAKEYKWYLQVYEAYVMEDGATDPSATKLSGQIPFFIVD